MDKVSYTVKHYLWAPHVHHKFPSTFQRLVCPCLLLRVRKQGWPSKRRDELQLESLPMALLCQIIQNEQAIKCRTW